MMYLSHLSNNYTIVIYQWSFYLYEPKIIKTYNFLIIIWRNIRFYVQNCAVQYFAYVEIYKIYNEKHMDFVYNLKL